MKLSTSSYRHGIVLLHRGLVDVFGEDGVEVVAVFDVDDDVRRRRQRRRTFVLNNGAISIRLDF